MATLEKIHRMTILFCTLWKLWSCGLAFFFFKLQKFVCYFSKIKLKNMTIFFGPKKKEMWMGFTCNILGVAHMHLCWPNFGSSGWAWFQDHDRLTTTCIMSHLYLYFFFFIYLFIFLNNISISYISLYIKSITVQSNSSKATVILVYSTKLFQSVIYFFGKYCLNTLFYSFFFYLHISC